MTLLSSVGGAAGPLYGGFFLALSKASAGKEKLNKAELGEVLSEGLADIQRRGKAQLGDKTMVDALTPALEAYRASPTAISRDALQAAVEQAHKSAEATIPLQARKGTRQLPGANAASAIRIRAPPQAGSCCRPWRRRAKPVHRSGDARMVGLVLVSHSKKLAEAVRELVLQMTAPDFPVAVAAGVGETMTSWEPTPFISPKCCNS